MVTTTRDARESAPAPSSPGWSPTRYPFPEQVQARTHMRVPGATWSICAVEGLGPATPRRYPKYAPRACCVLPFARRPTGCPDRRRRRDGRLQCLYGRAWRSPPSFWCARRTCVADHHHHPSPDPLRLIRHHKTACGRSSGTPLRADLRHRSESGMRVGAEGCFPGRDGS